ncbi:NfeD family protein [Reichenbachiella sp. MALMAid0571]|uniref:NfeD family protein n=1 Tax=Reichenbachiella sp. MALMAid0571 TaxID=3143939 RepID=UPI0032E030E4
MIEWVIIASLILVGIALVVVEIIFVPGTTIVGILGFALGGYGIYLGYDYFGSTSGHIILVASVLLAFAAILYSFKSDVWKRFSNKSVISSKVNEGLTSGLKEGDVGESVSSLKPIGKALFGDKEYEVSSRGNFITEKQSVKIIKIDKNKIYVESNN